MNRTAHSPVQTQATSTTTADRAGSGLKRSSGLPAVALAAVMTLAMLGGIDYLAVGGSAAGADAAAVQMAKASAPRA